MNVIEPHPSTAALATSGLDHDVKVWLPIADEHEFDRRELRMLTRKNHKDREHERAHPDADSDMIYYMLRQMVARVSAFIFTSIALLMTRRDAINNVCVVCTVDNKARRIVTRQKRPKTTSNSTRTKSGRFRQMNGSAAQERVKVRFLISSAILSF